VAFHFLKARKGAGIAMKPTAHGPPAYASCLESTAALCVWVRWGFAVDHSIVVVAALLYECPVLSAYN
jgi:hypothetical protein